jgi:hypothetical protein
VVEGGEELKIGDGLVFDQGTPEETEQGGLESEVKALGGGRSKVFFEQHSSEDVRHSSVQHSSEEEDTTTASAAVAKTKADQAHAQIQTLSCELTSLREKVIFFLIHLHGQRWHGALIPAMARTSAHPSDGVTAMARSAHPHSRPQGTVGCSATGPGHASRLEDPSYLGNLVSTTP